MSSRRDKFLRTLSLKKHISCQYYFYTAWYRWTRVYTVYSTVCGEYEDESFKKKSQNNLQNA